MPSATSPRRARKSARRAPAADRLFFFGREFALGGHFEVAGLLDSREDAGGAGADGLERLDGEAGGADSVGMAGGATFFQQRPHFGLEILGGRAESDAEEKESHAGRDSISPGGRRSTSLAVPVVLVTDLSGCVDARSIQFRNRRV